MFEKSQEDGYLDLCISRARNEYLTWVEQFLDIIENENYDGGLKINDIGCNVGQFWKGLKKRNLAELSYYGFDYELIYLNAAEKIFPELQGRLYHRDVTIEPLPNSDISVCSATLEHLPSFEAGLANIIKSTNKMVLLRTFLGDSQLTSINMKEGAKDPYLIRQFSFHEIFSTFSNAGFTVTIVRDRYTDSMPRYLSTGVIRSFFIIKAVKNQQ